MMSLPRAYRAHLLVLSTLGVALPALVLALAPRPVATPGLVSAAALWTLLLMLGDLSPIPLPRGGARARLTPALDLAALCVFGPVLTLGVGLFARLLAFVGRRDWSVPRLALDMGSAGLLLGGGGLAWLAAGGPVTVGGAQGSVPALAFFLTPLVYLALKFGADSLTAAFRDGRPATSIWRTAARWEMLHDAFFLPFGFLLVATWYSSGIPGAALFAVPLLMARYAFQLWSDTKKAHVATVRALVAVIDAGDPYTLGQAQRITRYALRVARYMGLPETAREELEYGALLHDIGRRFLQHGLLHKAGQLEGDEIRQMQAHPQLGHDFIAGLPFMSGAAELVLCHHEQPDGRGYPRGLAGTDIPPGARILMVAAAFDAMTADRSYRKGMPPDLACQELERCAGTQFFPAEVAALVVLHRQGQLCEDFTPTELEELKGTSTVINPYEELLAELRLGFDAPDIRPIELSPEQVQRCETALATGATAGVGIQVRPVGAPPPPEALGATNGADDDADDDQDAGDSRKVVNA